MSRLLIVSNRLPVTVKLENGKPVVHPSSGGLATAMAGPHAQGDSLWIGWPGEVGKLPPAELAHLETQFQELRAVPVYLSASEVSHYYNGFSNGVLWPLFHYMTDKIDREAWVNWNSYVAVNRKFCEAVLKIYQPGDVIWVHDYQLTLVPAMIRKLAPQARIGFFLHIPFPSSEVYRVLPWRNMVAEGMLGADLIGFHTSAYARHFSKSCLHMFGTVTKNECIRFGDRTVHLGIFPIGINAKKFHDLATHPDVEAELVKIRNESPGKVLFLGVDRLDYSKGLVRRFLAFERLLEREPELRHQVRMIQIVVPSREKVDSYRKLQRELDEIVGRINANFGSVSALPIHYLYRSVSEKHLTALYRAADVMIVSPLRDGMNLVAKEYIASRIDERGVLLLSEFAGAAAELVESLIINPYDLDGFALYMKKALLMSDSEKTARMRNLRHRVQVYDAFRWSQSFLEHLCGIKETLSDASLPITSRDEITKLSERLRTLPELHLLLDYDGTLVPFAETPELAFPDLELLKLFETLIKKPGMVLHVVSGRNRDSLETWFGHLALGLHAEHGQWSRNGPGHPWEAPVQGDGDWMKSVHPLLDDFVSHTPGALVEEKTSGLSWHYRMVEHGFGEERAQSLIDELKQSPVADRFEVLESEKILELRTRGVHKGQVIQRLLQQAKGPLTIVAMGDDRTDEDLFRHLPPGSVGLHVGPRPSQATYRLLDYRAARQFLLTLVE
jgi:trehalose 6-phosphate synthase/phosphatase